MYERGRWSATRRWALVAGLGVAGLAAAPRADAQGASIRERADGLQVPVALANSGDGSNRLFIAEQAGCIRFFLKGALRGAPCGQPGTRFLDIRSRVTDGGERGLLGLAFHPQYESNGFFFVYYTSEANGTPPARNLGDIVIARYSVTADRNVADPNSEQILLVIPHSQFSNHNGGQLGFGPDGFLYAAVGDGGSGGDPNDNGQNLNSLLGKLLRIDVNEPDPPFYSIPADNPFPSGGPGTCGDGCDEIWAYGLRNPWRFSFDRQTGDLYIGDVGQSAWEEIDFQPAGAAGGRNYGWDVLEGGLHGSGSVPNGNCHENVPVGSCAAFINGGSTLPVLEYDRNAGTTVIGGYVYRGPVQGAWTGSYVFADFGSGRIWRGFRDGGGNWQMTQAFSGINTITSFGEDDRGNLYFTRIDGTLFEIVPHSVLPAPPAASPAPVVEPAEAGEAGESASTPDVPQQALATFSVILQRAAGLASPIGLARAGDGSNRLFVVEQAGCIRFYVNGAIVGAPCGQAGTRFLDIRSRVTDGGERGLLGLAFHPQYASNGLFFVYYTSEANGTPPARNLGDIVIARYSVTADPNVADPNSEQILLVIPHSQFGNHNGGQLGFGPDGFLYAAVGDGGSGGDPGENAQNLNVMLGKLLRIDVNEPNPPFYRIPADNPFLSGGPGTCAPGPGACDEIWAFGLRNPWRFGFDRATGDLYIGDVGQSAWEEIDFQPGGTAGGQNYGWDVLEGGLHGSAQVPNGNCFEDAPAGSCTSFLNGGSTLPILEYDRATGTTVIGGTVYRGRPASAVWTGSYVFADFGSGRIWRAFRDGGGNWQMPQMFTGVNSITSFGEDDRGSLYFTRIGGTLHQIVPYTFADVPPTHPFWDFVERVFEAGVTGGCGGDNYCPDSATTREQMAVFVLRADDNTFVPPPCGAPLFNDVPASSPFCPWIEELARRQVVAGCGNGAYCPTNPVTRAQMAVFALATLEGPGYQPPACGTPMFNDVPASNSFCPWIEELARRGVVAGCGGGNYCPDDAISRGEMAVFLVGTFGLP